MSPTAISSGDSTVNSAAGGNKVRGIRSDTAMAPGTRDAMISVPRSSRSSSPESSSALGYRTGQAYVVQATPESDLPSGNDSGGTVSSRRDFEWLLVEGAHLSRVTEWSEGDGGANYSRS